MTKEIELAAEDAATEYANKSGVFYSEARENIKSDFQCQLESCGFPSKCTTCSEDVPFGKNGVFQ